MISTSRHPDLLDSKAAAEYMGVARLDQLPDEYRPDPVAYNTRLYHRATLDEIIERAAKVASARRNIRAPRLA